MEQRWHMWIRYMGVATIVGVGLMLTNDQVLQIVGAGIFLFSNLAFVARWFWEVNSGRLK